MSACSAVISMTQVSYPDWSHSLPSAVASLHLQFISSLSPAVTSICPCNHFRQFWRILCSKTLQVSLGVEVREWGGFCVLHQRKSDASAVSLQWSLLGQPRLAFWIRDYPSHRHEASKLAVGRVLLNFGETYTKFYHQVYQMALKFEKKQNKSNLD